MTMSRLPPSWPDDVARMYNGRLRHYAHARNLLDDEENIQNICIAILEKEARPGSAFSARRGQQKTERDRWMLHLYMVAKQALFDGARKHKNDRAAHEVRVVARHVVARRTARSIEAEQESRYRSGQPFLRGAHAAA